MKTKTSTILIISIIILILIISIALLNVKNNETKLSETNLTGSIETFEVSNEKQAINYQPTKTSERYDEKYLEYLDNIKESRDKTFQR